MTDNIDFIFADTDDVTTLAGIVGKLLAKSPDERYNDSDRVIADLTAALGIRAPDASCTVPEIRPKLVCDQ